jgi:hypothetical protein
MSNTFTFPSTNIPSSQKKEDYHRNFTLAICSRSFTSNFDVEYRTMESCQDYYNGVQTSEAFKFLQESVDGDALPALWINYNKIKPKIDLIQGEFIKRKHRLSVTSINRDAKSRKLEKKQDALTDLKLRPYIQPIQEQAGLQLMPEDPDMESEEDIEEFYSFSYKEKSEIVMKNALDYSLNKSRWGMVREALFRDLIITGRCFSKSELINGIPITRRIDPKFVIFDRNATNDYLTDSTYWGEVRYMSIAEAAQTYDIKEEDLKKLQSNYSAGNIHNHPGFRARAAMADKAGLQFFKTEGNELRVMVLEAYWEDYENITYKVSEDNYGNTHYKLISDDTKPNKAIKAKRCKVWRKGILIGGDIMVQYGKIKNQPRSIDNPTDTDPPYKGCVVNYLNYHNQGLVGLIMPLQDLKNISLYNVQLAMARAGAKGFVYDVSQTPEGWDVHTVIKYLKTAGIAFINSKQDDGLPSTFNQFGQIDLSLSNEVDKYLAISNMVDNEMNAITGVNEARQGLVQNASQAVGVTQSALLQSALSSEVYFNALSRTASEIFNYNAALIKVAWPQYADRFSPIIGDAGIDFLNEDVDLSLDDYAVVVEDVPVSATDTQHLTQMVHAALQNQQLTFIQALEILKETDIDRAIQRIKREQHKNERKQLQQMQQQQEQEQAQQQQALQAQQQQAQMMRTDSREKAQDKIREIAAKGKVDAILKNMDINNKQEVTSASV